MPKTAAMRPTLSEPVSVQNPISKLPVGKPLNILLVEDIKVNQALALKMLSVLGYSADTAKNGRHCLEMVKTKEYDLIFMDLYMPEMDGFYASQEIRQMSKHTPQFRQPYICALTANVMPKDQEACWAAGMNDILTKPIRLEMMHAALLKALDVIYPAA